jgi:4-hydroxythreonine-4-phosphate dehydrogenase
MKNNKIVVGITHGDINSISYEVIIKALLDTRILDSYVIIVYGSPKVAAYHRKALNIENFSFNTIKSPDEATSKRANIINCIDENIRVELGKSTEAAGESSIQALDMATEDLASGKIDVLVTGPINKHNVQSDKFAFAGHTEFLETRFGSTGALMFMVNDYFRIGVVTGHIPISKVSEYITKDSILQKLKIMNTSLIEDFGCHKPKIAVLGLNPHAGDNGVFGEEEPSEIIPAIEAAQDENILAYGPFPADGFFGSLNFQKFDGILAMYHDQGLIPFKSSAMGGGVNFTAGLPIIRTSPAHGTAFELAGKNEASPDSFRSAIYMACDIFTARKEFKQLTINPLKSYDISEM